MARPSDSARIAAAKSRFGAFFREIEGAFAERDDVIAQLALALLAREHVLLAGPPGTAKSALAGAVLGRILDEETGRPSLYARQLTESTVQTDVIGPIDFKTLLETGRTEHFTDEGLLGAVHAFLDEVFDGRDMLLRSTLNLLHERELKQGTQITRGRFEVAVMTTNRYVAEVLESARETLLAFVDRIAFMAFVPRGFAAPSRLGEVLRHQVGGAGRPTLEAPLTVQDLDALQAIVAEVHIPDEICDGLARLLDLFEAELSAAERADPSFLPTRYLSTRTAVRSGDLLRSICVYDSISRRPDRPLSVEPDDLRSLRLHLLLSGPAPNEVATLLARERDPREKRQLTILRTEREAFERAYAKLPTIRVPPPRPPPREGPPSRERSPASRGSGAPAPPPAPLWAVSAATGFSLGTPGAIVSALREVAPHAGASGEDAALAASLVRQGLALLDRHALHVTLAARAEDRVRVADVAREVADLADALDQGPGRAQALARWVRGRALLLLSTDAAAAVELGQVNVIAWEAERDAMTLLRDAEAKVGVLETRALERARLTAAGVDAALRHDADAAWSKGLAVVLEEVSALCDAGLRGSATTALSAGRARDLGQLLDDVGAVLERLRDLDGRVAALGVQVSLRTTVVGPRIAPLLAHTFGRVEVRDRNAYIAEVDRALRVLGDAGLANVVPASDWLTWAARALLRADIATPQGPAPAHSHDGYRELRGRGGRVPSGFVLAEVALKTAPAAPERGPTGDVPVAAELLAGLPADLRRDVAAADRRRIERVVVFLEELWGAVMGPADLASPGAAAEQLHRIVTSRFFAILLDDGAASRTLLEIELLGELFPEEAGATKALRERMDALVAGARRRVLALVQLRGEAAWLAALGGSGEGAPPGPEGAGVEPREAAP